MMLLFSLSRVYFVFLFDADALVKSWLLSEQMKCHPCCVPLDQATRSQCSPGRQCVLVPGSGTSLQLLWFLLHAGTQTSHSGGVWLFQLVPWCLRMNTCKTDMIWHGNEWKASTEFWLSEGMGLPGLWYQHFIFSLLWARNPSRDGLHSFMISDKCSSDTSLSTQKPFLI